MITYADASLTIQMQWDEPCLSDDRLVTCLPSATFLQHLSLMSRVIKPIIARRDCIMHADDMERIEFHVHSALFAMLYVLDYTNNE